MVSSPPGVSEESALLLEQMKYLQHEIASIQQHFLGIISVSVGVYAVIIYYALTMKEHGQIIFVLLPFFFLLSFYNILKYTIKTLGLEAYVRHLETRINDMYGKPLFLWQSGLIYANSYSFLGGLAQIPCIVAVVLFLGYQYVQNIETFHPFPGAAGILTGLLIVQIVCVCAMLLGCATQYFVVLYWCRNIPDALGEGESYFEYISGLKTMKTPWRQVFRSLKRELSRKSDREGPPGEGAK